MKLSHKQRLAVASQGVDPDHLENPKQKLPSLESRITKLERLINDGHPRAGEYREKLQIYRVLQGESVKPEKSWWRKLFGGLNG